MKDLDYSSYSDRELVELYDFNLLWDLSDENLFEELCWRAGLYVEWAASDDFYRAGLANRSYKILKGYYNKEV